MTLPEETLDNAATVIEDGGLVVYPTETVYGLGADALNPAAVARVFEVKGRSRDKPVSLACPTVEATTQYAVLSPEERAFAEEFLPGPVTLVAERRPVVPDVLTAGRDRVGLRVPDHEIARSLLERCGPLTATSANKSGTGSVRRIDKLSEELVAAVDTIIEGGVTPGGGSTVVDVAQHSIHRRGAAADAVETWLRKS